MFQSLSAPPPDLTDLRAGLMLNAFRDQLNAGIAVQGLVDGFADEFEDQSGVDLGASSNVTYDGVGAKFHNPGGYTADVTGAGTPTASASLYSGTAAQQFDNDQSNSSTCGYTPVSGSWLKYDFGAENEKTVVRYKIDTGHDGNTYAPKDWLLQGSNDDVTWTTVDSRAGVTGWSASVLRQFDCPSNGTAYRYYRLYITGSNHGTYVQINEVEYIENLPASDMTLVSAAQVALSAPDAAMAVLWQEDVDAITLGDDLTVEATRDDGVTWTAGDLSEVAALGAGRLLVADIDLSAQPSGTAMRYRVKTFNSKEQRFHAAGMDWGW